ncbi:4-hydroxy-tetrahydrodipicolinate reductase [bacterium]|nr:4-hydroxy-tetrahydrodipicolinate reductase [bacterium]
MGQMISHLINENSDLNLLAGVDVNDILSDEQINEADVLIDFSTPSAMLKYASIAAGKKKPMVIGTTGLTEDEINQLRTLSNKTAILFSPNMSLGVNVLWNLIKNAGNALNDSYKIEISETHHVHKKDKPSGTAKMMLQVAQKTKAGKSQDMPVEALRHGEVVGNHTIKFSHPLETLEITHRAHDRSVFAMGALTAAKWIVDKKPGLYDMSDVLNLG